MTPFRPASIRNDVLGCVVDLQIDGAELLRELDATGYKSVGSFGVCGRRRRVGRRTRPIFGSLRMRSSGDEELDDGVLARRRRRDGGDRRQWRRRRRRREDDDKVVRWFVGLEEVESET